VETLLRYFAVFHNVSTADHQGCLCAHQLPEFCGSFVYNPVSIRAAVA